MSNNPDIYLERSKSAVAITTGYHPEQLYIVWFSKTLDNYKALISTDVESGAYWEVTHNGVKGETYVDEYHKENNTAISDERLSMFQTSSIPLPTHH